MTDQPIPLPGSAEAIRNKCKCSPRRNANGMGAFQNAKGWQYEIAKDCPLHATEKTT